MATFNHKSVVIFIVSLVVMIPALNANIGNFDDYWQQKAEKAQKVAHETYNPHPEEITEGFTKQIEQVMTGTNGTRRSLGKKSGPCKATNPIDRCWRCRPDWESDRFRLADCVKGFGHKTTGGKGGKIYIITDSSDDSLINPKPGTLRYAVIQKEPLWIIFARPMVIRLSQELMINSHKTIDARGANVHIAHGAGLTIQYQQNVIIHGLHIHDIHAGWGGFIRDSVDHFGLRTRSDGDGISIYGSSNIWIDHVSMRNCEDGLIDAIMGSTGITISNSHFTKHNEVMLFGANDKHTVDEIMQITVAFNHFGKGLIQRMPRCRFGFVHVVNNDYTHWRKYAIGGSKHPIIISQGNRFIAPHDNNLKEITHRDYATEAEWKTWTWRSEGDLYMNGAFFRQAGKPLSSHNYTRYQFIKAKPGSWVTRLTRYSGPIKCKPNKPC